MPDDLRICLHYFVHHRHDALVPLPLQQWILQRLAAFLQLLAMRQAVVFKKRRRQMESNTVPFMMLLSPTTQRHILYFLASKASRVERSFALVDFLDAYVPHLQPDSWQYLLVSRLRAPQIAAPLEGAWSATVAHLIADNGVHEVIEPVHGVSESPKIELSNVAQAATAEVSQGITPLDDPLTTKLKALRALMEKGGRVDDAVDALRGSLAVLPPDALDAALRQLVVEGTAVDAYAQVVDALVLGEREAFSFASTGQCLQQLLLPCVAQASGLTASRALIARLALTQGRALCTFVIAPAILGFHGAVVRKRMGELLSRIVKAKQLGPADIAQLLVTVSMTEVDQSIWCTDFIKAMQVLVSQAATLDSSRDGHVVAFLGRCPDAASSLFFSRLLLTFLRRFRGTVERHRLVLGEMVDRVQTNLRGALAATLI